MAMTSRTNVHGPGSYLMKYRFLLPDSLPRRLGRLCARCETDNLPTFVVLPDPRGLPYNQKGNFTSGFLL